ncbi:MAG: GxxExxY protein, partial [Spirochaetes bacterium]|nr:GxxExxY protein [Spirochaetota bacterium]
MTENEISKIIINCSIDIHKELGPGLLESVYEIILAFELENNGLKVDRQKIIPISYKGLNFIEAFRADVIVNNSVIIEIKSVEKLSKAHAKQLLTYLRLTNKKLGLLLNFGEALLKDGIQRVVN